MTEYEVVSAFSILFGVLIYGVGWAWAWRAKDPDLGIALSLLAVGQFVAAALVPVYGYDAGKHWSWIFGGIGLAYIVIASVRNRILIWWFLRRAAQDRARAAKDRAEISRLQARTREIEAAIAERIVRNRLN